MSETMLIHGGASGIGTTAIQLASALGARVFATVGTDEKVALCERLGASLAVNYRTNDFAEAIMAATDGRGVDLILDIVGADYLQKNLKLLAIDGRLVIIGLLGGSRTEINLAPLLTRRLTVTASTLRSRTAEEKGAIARALLSTVWPLLESGQAWPVIQKMFPLQEAAAAHTLLEENASLGKLVLVVDQEN